MVKIYTVGGFSEVGKNMAVLELDEDAFIFDEGLSFNLFPVTIYHDVDYTSTTF